MANMADDTPAAILTPKQRALIRGQLEDEPTGSALRAMRKRIRERVRAAVTTDAHLLLTAFDEGLVDPDAILGDTSRKEVSQAVTALTAVGYVIGQAANIDVKEAIDQGTEGVTAPLSAAERQLKEQGEDPEEVAELYNRLQRGEDKDNFSSDEVQTLLRASMVGYRDLGTDSGVSIWMSSRSDSDG